MDANHNVIVIGILLWIIYVPQRKARDVFIGSSIIPGGALVGFSVIPGGVFVGVISKYVASGSEIVGVKNMVAGGDTSVGDPSKKIATHSTTVPLYCGWAGMVRVYTMLPFSLTKSVLISENCLTVKPFTLQEII